MKELLQNKIVTGLIVTATFILGGVAIFTAVRLYQLRNQNISPTAPQESDASYKPSSTPTPQTPKSCGTLTFTLETQTGTPTLTPTKSASGTPTSTPTKTPTPTTTASVTVTQTATLTPTTGSSTSTPTPTTGNTTESSPTTTPTTVLAQASPTPDNRGGATLPNAGVGIPTLFALSFGVLILVLSIGFVL